MRDTDPQSILYGELTAPFQDYANARRVLITRDIAPDHLELSLGFYQNIDSYSGGVNWTVLAPKLPLEWLHEMPQAFDNSAADLMLKAVTASENPSWELEKCWIKDDVEGSMLAQVEDSEGMIVFANGHQIAAIEQLSAHSGEWYKVHEDPYHYLLYLDSDGTGLGGVRA